MGNQPTARQLRPGERKKVLCVFVDEHGEVRRTNGTSYRHRVAGCAGVSRKTVYKHTDLLTRIRNDRHQPRIVPVEPAPVGHRPAIAALRNELTTRKTRYGTEIARLKGQLRQREDELAAAFGELHRRMTRDPDRS